MLLRLIMQQRKKTVPILIALIVILAITAIVFNRMYMKYRHENKVLQSTIGTETLINNGLSYEKTGIDKTVKALYENTAKDCGANSPAYECSGLVTHGLRLQEQQSPWSHRPIDENNSVAFSFLREDHKFSSSADYGSGIIFFPLKSIPQGKDSYTVLCAYPADGSTDAKKTNNFGCGPLVDSTINDYFSKDILEKVRTIGIEKNSGNCLDYDLTTAQKWFDFHVKNHYFQDKSIIMNMFSCSYPMAGNEKSAESFSVVTDIRKLLDEKEEYKPNNWNNELLVAAWNGSKPETLPVMAIFYTIGETSTLNNALLYQRSFFDKTGEIIPLVGIKFPADKNDEAEFVEFVNQVDK